MIRGRGRGGGKRQRHIDRGRGRARQTETETDGERARGITCELLIWEQVRADWLKYSSAAKQAGGEVLEGAWRAHPVQSPRVRVNVGTVFLNTFQPSRDPSNGWLHRHRQPAMAPPASTRMSRLKRVQEHISRVNAIHVSMGRFLYSEWRGFGNCILSVAMDSRADVVTRVR